MNKIKPKEKLIQWLKVNLKSESKSNEINLAIKDNLEIKRENKLKIIQWEKSYFMR